MTYGKNALLPCQIRGNIIPDHIATDKKRLLLNGDLHFIAADGVTAFNGSAHGLNRKIAARIFAAKTSIIRKDFAPDGRDQRAGTAGKWNSK